MKTALLILLFAVGQITDVFCQADHILKTAERETIGSYLKAPRTPLKINEFRILLHVDFGKSKILNHGALFQLSSGVIKQVKLYYSDFPKGKDMRILNKARINALLGQVYELDVADVEWTIVKQTGGTSNWSASQLFHGFEIILEFPEEMKLNTLEIDSEFEDYVVEKVLKRNGWREMLIVSDMTGSMGPYISQLFLWLKLNTIDQRIKQFVFFNDGDTQLDEDKKVGKTGGIYQTRSRKYEEVEKLAIRSMLSGTGGDDPENDVEALLAGIKLCPDCAEFILIADNKSPMRDLALLKKVKKPIRVIVCGAGRGVKPEYLDLARQTGGSIHLIEEDLFDLMKLNEGETIELAGVTYQIEKGHFVRLKSM